MVLSQSMHTKMNPFQTSFYYTLATAGQLGFDGNERTTERGRSQKVTNVDLKYGQDVIDDQEVALSRTQVSAILQ